MSRIGALVPVTPVPLACAAIQSFDRDFIPRAELLERMAEMRDALARAECARRAPRRRHRGDLRSCMAHAAHATRARRGGRRIRVLPHGRELVSYYANSVAHLLGPFEGAVRTRDALAGKSQRQGSINASSNSKYDHARLDLLHEPQGNASIPAFGAIRLNRYTNEADVGDDRRTLANHRQHA